MSSKQTSFRPKSSKKKKNTAHGKKKKKTGRLQGKAILTRVSPSRKKKGSRHLKKSLFTLKKENLIFPKKEGKIGLTGSQGTYSPL